MGQSGRIKPYLQRPSGISITPDLAAFLDWVQGSLNTLAGQQFPQNAGITATSPNTIAPTNSQITSQGSRVSSIASPIMCLANATSLQFFWDGTNSSTPLTIYRDDGTVVTSIFGNFTITGLAMNTQYFLYPFYQENLGPPNNFGSEVPGVNWAFVSGKGFGTPPVAYTAPLPAAAQIQIARDHIPLAVKLAQSGVVTGTGIQSVGGGGGGAGAALASTF